MPLDPNKIKELHSNISNWVSDGLLSENSDSLKIISEFSKEIADNQLTTTQLRKFFAAVKKLDIQFKNSSKPEEEFKNNFFQVKMIMPVLAYAVGRAKPSSGKDALKSLYEALEKGINSLNRENYNTFKNFVQIFEAIVAYHKYHGGRD